MDKENAILFFFNADLDKIDIFLAIGILGLWNFRVNVLGSLFARAWYNLLEQHLKAYTRGFDPTKLY